MPKPPSPDEAAVRVQRRFRALLLRRLIALHAEERRRGLAAAAIQRAARLRTLRKRAAAAAIQRALRRAVRRWRAAEARAKRLLYTLARACAVVRRFLTGP